MLESSLSRTYKYLQNYDCCTISAFRPHAKIKETDEEIKSKRKAFKKNKENSSLLGQELKKRGYTYFLVDGSWVDNFGTPDAKENSELTYFVVNSNFDKNFIQEMKKIGQAFDQDAVMIYPKGKKPYLIGTSKRPEAFLGYEKIEKLNNIEYGKENKNMTRVNGRPYHASIFNY